MGISVNVECTTAHTQMGFVVLVGVLNGTVTSWHQLYFLEV